MFNDECAMLNGGVPSHSTFQIAHCTFEHWALSADLTRREVLKHGLAGAAGLVLMPAHLALAQSSQPATQAAAQPASATSAKGPHARAVIQIWMWGGPSHLDTFDPKPAAGSDYCGPLTSPIETNVPGVRISELLPLLAKQADKYA